LNRGYTKVQDDFQYSIPECEASTTITTVWGTQEYNKPSDLVRVTGFFDNTFSLERITKQRALQHDSSNTKPSSYYLYGDKIWLYPTPDSTYPLTFLYAKRLPEITSAVDSVLSKDMEDLMILWACYLMLMSVEKQQKATMCLTQYTSSKDSQLWNSLYDDDSITFGTQRSMDRVRDDAI
jgi:hypothetical protein